jgi:hypothetical protein
MEPRKGQVEIQREGAEAWIRLVEGNSEEALRQCVLPLSTKTLVTSTLSPAESSCPARELPGELLLDLNKPAELKFLQKSGQVPNRLICSFSYPCSRAVLRQNWIVQITLTFQ